MRKEMLIGLGLGLVLYPAAGYLNQIPIVGQYTTLVIVVVGVALIIKGVMSK